MTSREMAGFGMTIMAVGLRMSSGVMRGRCASGSGTELPRRDKDRSGEYKPDSHDRTSLPPRPDVRMAGQEEVFHLHVRVSSVIQVVRAMSGSRMNSKIGSSRFLRR